MIGYSLWPGYPIAGALFLYGDGRNGKSTLLEVIKRLLGQENLSSLTTTHLVEDKLVVSYPHGPLANPPADLPP
jgi:putative DNA primase/helicase